MRVYILDWGGGKGWMSKKLSDSSSKLIVNLDPDESQLKINPKNILTVRGIGQNLPFRDNSFSGVHIRAALHHINSNKNNVEKALNEIWRVLEDNGFIFIQEPLCKNPISKIARKIFPTEIHDPDEQPFDPKDLVALVSNRFNILTVRYFYLTSYLLPHIVSRLPLKTIWRKLAKFLVWLDAILLSYIPFLRNYAEYIEIIGVKKGV